MADENETQVLDNNLEQPVNGKIKQTAAKKSHSNNVATKKSATKKAAKGASKRIEKKEISGKKRTGGAAKAYPTATFESVLPLAKTIFEHAGASREMKRSTVFELLGRASESGPGRTLVINSGRYGLTIGGTQAEILRLTDEAVMILNPSAPAAEAIRTRYNLAIQGITPFNILYQRFRGGRLPAIQVMIDALEDIDPDDRQETVQIFIGNLDYIGLLNTVEGAQWIVNIDTEFDVLKISETGKIARTEGGNDNGRIESHTQSDFELTCFFIAPIGNEGEEKRKHSDMVLSTLVTPSLSPFNLNVIRADQIAKPGMISKQILEYIMKSRLVIVDLSFHNPNVFYELAIRHLLGKPTVHIVKKSDGIPFDIGNFRTIELEDIGYDFVARIETHKITIANYVREALDGSSSADNPILAFFPELKVSLST